MFDIDLSSVVSNFDIDLYPVSRFKKLYIKINDVFNLYPVFTKKNGVFEQDQVAIKQV